MLRHVAPSLAIDYVRNQRLANPKALGYLAPKDHAIQVANLSYHFRRDFSLRRRSLMREWRKRLQVLGVHTARIPACVMDFVFFRNGAVVLCKYPSVGKVLTPVPMDHTITSSTDSKIPVPAFRDRVNDVEMILDQRMRRHKSDGLTGNVLPTNAGLFRQRGSRAATTHAQSRWIRRRDCVQIFSMSSSSILADPTESLNSIRPRRIIHSVERGARLQFLAQVTGEDRLEGHSGLLSWVSCRRMFVASRRRFVVSILPDSRAVMGVL